VHFNEFFLGQRLVLGEVEGVGATHRRADPGQRLGGGEGGRLVGGVENGHEAHHAIVRHASSTAADRDGSRVVPAVVAVGQGRNDVLPDLMGCVDEKSFSGSASSAGRPL